MGAFLSYTIVSGLALLIFYLAYRGLLARDKQHAFNRGVLLCIYLVSFMTPLIFSALEVIVSAGHSLGTLPPETASNSTIITTMPPSRWSTALIWVFMAGMAVVAAKTITTWLRLMAVIRSGEKINRGAYILVVTDNEKFAPFSWMRYIVVSRSDHDSSCSAITDHELKHLVCQHWIDLLIAQAVCIINWFNPAAWLMRDELILIHEYQADMAVIDSGHNPQEYQMLLIKKAVGTRFPSLANSLNHSKLKKRITMMYKEKSGARHKIKALALVPTLAVALAVVSVPAVRATVSTISRSEISIGKDSENLPDSEKVSQHFRVTDINKDGSSTKVVIKGKNLGPNLTVSGGTFTNKGTSYNANSLKCNMTDGKADITVSFTVSEEYEDSEMLLIINGEEVRFNFKDFLGN